MRGTYQIAGHCLEIRSLHESVHRLCADYQLDAPAEFVIETSGADIQTEREKSGREDLL